MLPELQAVLKKEGKKLGIGSGVLLVGLGIMGVAALYLVYALILVLDLALPASDTFPETIGMSSAATAAPMPLIAPTN